MKLSTNASLSKKQMKKDINKNGFFINLAMEIKKNAPDEYKPLIPEGATYFEGIASNGDLNRNGYKIREKAWIDAIAGYFVNPVILLQHDTDQPIGKALFANVGNEGLKVGGYVFDEYTENRFSRGLFRALSTGHYDIEREFENEETGEVLDEATFIEKFNPSRSWWTGDVIPPAGWIICVTKLEWVEFSVVSIGSNRRSLVTKQNALISYFKNKYENKKDNEQDDDDTENKGEEDKEEIKTEEEEKKEVETEPTQTPATETEKKEEPTDNKENIDTADNPTQEPVKEPETTPAEEPVKTGEEAGTEEGQPAEVKAEKSPLESLLVNGMTLPEFEKAFKQLYTQCQEKDSVIDDLLGQIETLSAKLYTPVKKGLSLIGDEQIKENKEPALAKLFAQKGISLKE